MIAVFPATATAKATDACGAESEGIVLQVLGSGGPVADDARAGAGYLLWIDGRARILIDAGGGVFQRFGAARARLEDLALVAITHFHADHVADLAALVKAGYFSSRRADLVMSGPRGGGAYPSPADFLDRQFSADAGAYAYLAGALDGTRGHFALRPVEIDPGLQEIATIVNEDGLLVHAAGVDHGPVPALGYVIDAGGRRVAVSGDTAGLRDDFWRLASGADLLIVHHAIPEDADRVARNLHATPSTIGRRAAQSKAKLLVLSHLMARSLATIDDSLRRIAEDYAGPVAVAEDLACYPLRSENGP